MAFWTRGKCCSPEKKIKIDCYIKCENCNRKLAGPSLFWHMQKPPYAQGSVSQFQGHSCSRAWGELAPYCAPHIPPVHLHPPTFPPSAAHASTHSPPYWGAFFSFCPNHGCSPNNVVYFSNGAGKSQARQGCPFAAETLCDRKKTCLWWLWSKAAQVLITCGQVSCFTFCLLHSLSVICLV